MTGLKPALFTPQNFWNNTGITVEQLHTFDRGNNSERNLELLESEGLGFHYVGGFKKIRWQSYMRFSKVVINRCPALRMFLRNMNPSLRTG